eukprot:jgi/Botrbrau1/18671/Bobra.0386s0001.4
MEHLREVDLSAFGLTPLNDRDPSGAPLLSEVEGETLVSFYPDVSLVLGEKLNQGPGKVYVTSRRIIWLSQVGPEHGCYVAFPSISVHATVRDCKDDADRPYIYLQLEPFPDAAPSSNEEDENLDMSPEVRLVPSDPGCLQSIFEAMCEAAANNPDPGLEEDEGDFIYDANIEMGCSEAQREAMLARLEGLLEVPGEDAVEELIVNDPSRFEDPDNEEDGDEDGDDTKFPGGHFPSPTAQRR